MSFIIRVHICWIIGVCIRLAILTESFTFTTCTGTVKLITFAMEKRSQKKPKRAKISKIIHFGSKMTQLTLHVVCLTEVSQIKDLVMTNSQIMKSIYILNPRAPKKAKICQIYPPSSQSGSLHFVLHLYRFVIYQNEDLDFRISKIGTKCGKN